MLKKPLSVSIFLVLFIGLSDYGYGCHKKTMEGVSIQHGKKNVTVTTPTAVAVARSPLNTL